ncbi:MAG: lamin tail domain-containing protein [Candidatus Nealsonbacteria bacterium]|nr:lamin tail domain-containing protein [Candidatus Nealsonbacteria bacterium]
MTILSSPRVKYLVQGLKVVVFLSLFFIAFAAQAVNPLDVVINELAWMGTNISANDEWIELYNNTESPINLDNWQLVSQDGTPKINLSGTIPANGFYLLERTDDTTVPNVPADQIYTGALGNSGETLELYDNFGNLIDRVDDSSGWSAGDNSTKQIMERKNPQFEGSDPNNWQTSQNAGGTPKAKNSIVVQAEPQPKPESEKTAVEEPTVEVRLQQTYPTGVVINEILPSPEGPDSEEEWTVATIQQTRTSSAYS